MVRSCCIMEFCNDSNVMYSKERNESTKLLVDTCGVEIVGKVTVPDVASDVGDGFVVNGEDGIGALRLKANFALGTDAARKSASVTSSVFNCCASFLFRHLGRKLSTDLLVLSLNITRQRPSSVG